MRYTAIELAVGAWLVAVVGGVRILNDRTTINQPVDPAVATRADPSGASIGESRAAKSSPSSSWVAPQSPDDHLVSDPLPLWRGEAFPTQHWAGHLPASDTDDKYLFYWLFAPDFGGSSSGSTTTTNASSSSSTAPLIIWLNGGPGCSSMDGLWLENGPFRLTLDSDTHEYGVTSDPHSWHRTPAYTLYVDQPVGTGLSFTMTGTYPSNDEEVNVDFYHFLQSFLSLHKDLFVADGQVHRPVYFSGESHAGHYIPSMMNYILKRNDALLGEKDASSDGRLVIPLAGAAIGNGWTDPYHQYAAAEAAYGKGLIGRSQWYALDQKERDCQSRIAKGDFTAGVCFSLLNNVVDQSQGSSLGYKVSTYDARRSEPRHADRTFPPGHKVVETYLGGWELENDPGTLDSGVADQVLKAIHATAAADAKQRYRECTDPPYEALAHQDGLGVVPDVVEILHHPTKPRLLFFNGIEDLICNHVGNEKMLENLPWTGKDSWIQSPRYAWRAKDEVAGQVSGYMKEYNNLLFLKVLNAGHMVPMDVPPVALEMMQIFVAVQSFSMSRQSLTNAPQDNSCPVCPDCPTCQGAPDCNDNAPQPEKCEPCDVSSAGAQSHSVPSPDAGVNKGVVGGLVAVSFLLGGLLMCLVFRNGKRHASRSLVPQYDLELRQRQYMDEPTNDLELS